MLPSKHRLLAIVGMGLPLLVAVIAVAVWGFRVEIRFALTESVVFPATKPILALGTFLVGCFMAFGFSLTLARSLQPQKSCRLRCLELTWIGFPLLMAFGNSLAIMLAADRPSLAFTISAWATLACLVGYFPAIGAFSLAYASQRRAADLLPRGEAVE